MPPEPQINHWVPPKRSWKPLQISLFTELKSKGITLPWKCLSRNAYCNGHTFRWACNAHANTHIQYTCKHTTECVTLPPRNFISASIYLVKGEMGRAGSVLSAYFSKTINSVHKTHWSKTLKGKSTFSLQPVRLCSGRQRDLKCQ